MARPRKEINKEQFEKLCNLQCTKEEICGFFGITDKTLTGWCERTYGLDYSEAFKTYSQDGKISLRRTQFRMAERNPAMAIWLGKQYLGQTEKIDQQIISIDADVRDKVEAAVKAARRNKG